MSEIMNTANKLTIFRFILVPFFVCFLLSKMYTISLIIFFIAALTDHFDGKIARKQGKVTNFGKFADPLADKALVMSAFVCFVEMKELSSTALILMLLREFVVTSVRLIAAKEGKVIFANLWGKAKTVSQILTVILILSLLAVGNFSHAQNFVLIKEIFIWISVGLSVLSGTIYIYENRELLQGK